MYYINKEVRLNSGVVHDLYDFHIITHLGVNYVTQEISATLCSYKSLLDLAKNFINKDANVDLCSNYFNLRYDISTFNLDPSLVALRTLVSTEDSQFFKAEIKRIYDDDKYLSSLLPPEPDNVNEVLSGDRLEDPFNFIPYHKVLEEELSGGYTISNVTVANVLNNLEKH